MPTIMTHSVVALSAGCIFDRVGVPKRFWVLAIIAAVLPDADVIGYQYLYIPYGHILGHRGLFPFPILCRPVQPGGRQPLFSSGAGIVTQVVGLCALFLCRGRQSWVAGRHDQRRPRHRPAFAVFQSAVLPAVDPHRGLAYRGPCLHQSARPDRDEKRNSVDLAAGGVHCHIRVDRSKG